MMLLGTKYCKLKSGLQREFSQWNYFFAMFWSPIHVFLLKNSVWSEFCMCFPNYQHIQDSDAHKLKETIFGWMHPISKNFLYETRFPHEISLIICAVDGNYILSLWFSSPYCATTFRWGSANFQSYHFKWKITPPPTFCCIPLLLM